MVIPDDLTLIVDLTPNLNTTSTASALDFSCYHYFHLITYMCESQSNYTITKPWETSLNMHLEQS